MAEKLRRLRAILWRRMGVARYRYFIWKKRYGSTAAVGTLLLLIAFSFLLISPLQEALTPYFRAETQIAALRAFFVQLGGSLIGAAAIVSSLVLFAMQVNIERMPHGLFRMLSSDRKLLSAFSFTFLLAVTVTSLCLIPDHQWIGVALVAGFWGTILILVLFLYSYRRALYLINPIQQLNSVLRRTQRELRSWVRRAKRAEPLLRLQDTSDRTEMSSEQPQRDVARLTYFQVNPGWAESALQGVKYATSFARRYSEQGDQEVSAAALNIIVAINAVYIEAKGKTFFAHQLLFDNPYTSDEFINETLEQFRQTIRAGISRGDEQQIEQAFRCLTALVGVYLKIDYASADASKTHAHLATTYLAAEVERIVPHGMPDVLMEGVRLMGKCADMLLVSEGPIGIVALTQKIGAISSAGAVREEYRAVSLTGVEQLARLSSDLLRTRSCEVGYAERQIRSTMASLAKYFLTIPDTPLFNVASTYLAPYYSAASAQGLVERLSHFVNTVMEAPPNDADARKAIANLREWADDISETEREVLLRAIEKRSHFAFDIIHRITAITKILITASNAAACNNYYKSELQCSAVRLVSVLSWIPTEKETVSFVETFRMTEIFFEAAADAHRLGCTEVFACSQRMLLSWMFKAGQHQTPWSILQRSLCGLAVLALLADDPGAVDKLKAEISSQLMAGGLPDKEARDRAAKDVRNRAANLDRPGHWSSNIAFAMSQVDSKTLRPLLNEIASLISPDTEGQWSSDPPD
ncbi:hypothetical protein PQJ75_13655 [Rhodoplanes sp. TEM]|uniref:DUF2254 domain-containing protein n=1 Tax=Rhodoplanes tepidamans TaxID=200616 RepID=A0ABT5JCW9_RHOTP|nr:MULTISPECIES: hypothetical protein [Rhodoplanes]MDC7787342.1 hypothetical protein [Rhodoplanes tepidamans]MDC7984776.1 hypothetical protein [Rhodoplanes sp. TEM]MDQ0358253.1 hypothetical protein [Rhodoplanes tepidamans]